jgi:SAM-dependent methyltransferase
MTRNRRVQTLDTIREDFDHLALLPNRWNHNVHYQRWLFRQVPRDCDRALDAGCGSGAFTLALAELSRSVLGIDLSPVMIDQARRRSRDRPGVEFRVANLLTEPLGGFDCITSIAALHHVPFESALIKLRDMLRPGGILIILDVVGNKGPIERLWAAKAMPVALALRLLHTGRLTEPRDEREAWAAHGQTDRYSTINEIRDTCARVLPGARVRRRLLWRYSIVWEKVNPR